MNLLMEKMQGPLNSSGNSGASGSSSGAGERNSIGADLTASAAAAMCANGLLGIQDILRSRGAGGDGSGQSNNTSSPGGSNGLGGFALNPHHLSQLHSHGLMHPHLNPHHHAHLSHSQLNHPHHHPQGNHYESFGGLGGPPGGRTGGAALSGMFPIGMMGGLNKNKSSISPPVGPDQSPPATPPLALHSPDGSKDRRDRMSDEHKLMDSMDSSKGKETICI